MRYSEVLERLQNLTNTKITQAELCKILNIKQSAMGNRQNRDSHFSDEEITTLEKHFNVELSNTEIEVDYYPDVLVSCGNGVFALGETKEKISIPKKFVNHYSPSQKYIVVTAFSDSMQPEIKEKDLLIVRVTNLENIIDNHIYVFCHEGRFYCKYLSYNLGQLIIKSSNPNYPTRYIEKQDLENFELIGEIVGLMRNLR